MSLARRRVLQTLALAAGVKTVSRGQETRSAQEPKFSPDVLRAVSAVHGTNLSESRQQVIQPALEHHLDQLRAFRAFEIDDGIGPTAGILSK